MKLTSEIEVHYELCRTPRRSWGAVTVFTFSRILPFSLLPSLLPLSLLTVNARLAQYTRVLELSTVHRLHRVVFFFSSSFHPTRAVQDLFFLYLRYRTGTIGIFLEYKRARNRTDETVLKIDFQVANSIAVGGRSQSTIKRASGIIKKLSTRPSQTI